MTIYDPVTDIGKAIAKALRRDDGIRLDIHDILEKWEPEYIADMKKAEKWDWLTKKDPLLPYDFDKLIKTDKTPVLLSDEAYRDFVDRAQKLEAVKIAYEAHRDNILEVTGELNMLAHVDNLPAEYHYALEKLADDLISYGPLRKILEGEV